LTPKQKEESIKENIKICLSLQKMMESRIFMKDEDKEILEYEDSIV